jgi:hypothetical protein
MNTDLTVLHDTLVERLNALTTSDQWLGWLQSARRFHRYSPHNQLLLQLQCATGHVASYRTWQRIPAEGGGTCQVRRGEHGMTILAPLTVTRREIDEATGDETCAAVGLRGYRPVKVFHQGQLVAPPDLPERPMPALLTGENRWQHVWAAVTSHLEDLGYDIELVSRPPVETWNGRTSFADGLVEIADVNEPPQRLKTLIHEWAHIALDHADRPGDVHRGVLEVEAESVAYLVCTTIRLDSSAYSLPYLASWSDGDPSLVEATAKRVLATTAMMVGALESEMSIDLTPDLLTVTQPGSPAPLHPPPHRPRLTVVPGETLGLRPPPPTVYVDVPDDLRQVVNRLDGADAEQFLTSLGRIDEDLDILTALCADANLDARATHDLLISRGADPLQVHRSMTRPVVDSQRIDHDEVRPERPLFTGIPPVGPVPDTLERLDAADREALDHFDLTRGHHVVTAATLLPADRIDAAAAVEILTHYGANITDIHDALSRDYHNPASGRPEPRWPLDEINAATGHHPPPATASAAPPATPIRRADERPLPPGPAGEIIEQWAAIINSDPTPTISMP